MKKLLLTFAIAIVSILGVQAQSTTLKVWLDSKVTFQADGTTVTYLKLYENDGDQGYTSFNMSLIVPKGISVNKVKQGRNTVDDIFLSERATTTHTIACNMPSETLLKVACISTLNQDLYNDDEEGNPLDELWTIGLLADPTMENGDYVVTMPVDGLIFNMKDGDNYVSSRISEDVTCVFTIEGGVITAIKQVTVDAEDASAIYALQGRKLTNPVGSGVSIIDGKKVATKEK